MHMTVNNNSAKRKHDNTMPTTDEGWWESVLAEERLHAPTRPQPVVVKPKPTPETKAELVQEVAPVQANWDEVKALYANDRIITMKVTGHNRGGLLVEADSLAGFVPFSHLIDLAG